MFPPVQNQEKKVELQPAEENIFWKITRKGPETWNRWTILSLSAAERKLIGVESITPLSKNECLALARELGINSLPDPRQIDFRDLRFGDLTFFSNLIFPSPIQVVGGSYNPDFSGSQFANMTLFGSSIFMGSVNFSNVRFADYAAFGGSRFVGITHFSRARFEKTAAFINTLFDSNVFFDETEFCEDFSFTGGYVAGYANFSGKSPFLGNAEFRDRDFRGPTTFAGRTFTRAPIFHNARLHQDTSFLDTDFDSIFLQTKNRNEWDQTARAFRTLTLKFKDLNSLEEELKFFALELKSKERMGRGGKELLIKAYRKFSNYGQSILIPTIWLFRTFLAALLVNLLVVFSSPKDYCTNPLPEWNECGLFTQVTSTAAYTLSSSVPFLGQSKTAADLAQELFPGSSRNYLYFVSVAQGLLSAVFVFLIGLGVRNRFRIK